MHWAWLEGSFPPNSGPRLLPSSGSPSSAYGFWGHFLPPSSCRHGKEPREGVRCLCTGPGGGLHIISLHWVARPHPPARRAANWSNCASRWKGTWVWWAPSGAGHRCLSSGALRRNLRSSPRRVTVAFLVRMSLRMLSSVTLTASHLTTPAALVATDSRVSPEFLVCSFFMEKENPVTFPF